MLEFFFVLAGLLSFLVAWLTMGDTNPSERQLLIRSIPFAANRKKGLGDESRPFFNFF
jgi:hypothetical protein